MKHCRELGQYSGLIYLLLWRNIKLRYRQTIVGAAWALLQPLLAMVIFTILFARLITIPTGGAPYPGMTRCAALWSTITRMRLPAPTVAEEELA